jgi:uncharacterized protein
MVGKYLNIGTRLPDEYITRRAVIIAKVDSGKTYTAGVIEEQFAKKGLPFIVMDPMGAHWGIRSKYPVLIVGGSHGDIELQSGDGRYIARLIVAQNLSCICDINEFSKENQQQFAADFGDELFLLHKISSSPRHVFWEEADIFAPQKTRAVSLPVLDTLVRRGRQFGIGSTMITQRPAVLNKDVLTQADIYFFLNLIAEQDIKVVAELIKASNATKEERVTYIEQIMKFEKGEMLLFSPSWLKKIKVFQGKKKETYHAGQTPVYGVIQKIPPLLNYETKHIKNALNKLAGSEEDCRPLIQEKDLKSLRGAIFAAVGIIVVVILVL